MGWHSVRKDAELWLKECKFIRQATLNITLEDLIKIKDVDLKQIEITLGEFHKYLSWTGRAASPFLNALLTEK